MWGRNLLDAGGEIQLFFVECVIMSGKICIFAVYENIGFCNE